MGTYRHKLFKQFFKLDFNDYYIANIFNEIYFAVGTQFYYDEQTWLGKRQRSEEQNFASVKIPNHVALFLHELLERKIKRDENGVIVDSEPLVDVINRAREKVFGELVTMEERMLEQNKGNPEAIREIKRYFKSDYEKLHTQFNLEWSNPTIEDHLSKGWELLLVEYAGRATRNVFLVRTQSELVTILGIKLFGNAELSEVVDYKRILMNDEIVNAFCLALEEITRTSDAKTSKGAKL